MHEEIRSCRSCASQELELVLDLGEMPLADGLVKDRSTPEAFYPLSVVVCGGCGLAQLRETVSPDTLFCDDYPYYSSFIPSLLRHSEANVSEIVERESLSGDDLVVELASNDGYLLQYYAERGIQVLGIDPADGPVAAARDKGIESLNAFFTMELAEKLRGEGRAARVIHANNVLAHVPDLNGFVKGIETLLRDDGVAVIECPHVLQLITHCEFDTIYHEHLCYFSVTALRALFARHGLCLSDVRELPIHGGSLRLYVRHGSDEGPAVARILEQEAAAGLDTPAGYRDFGRRVEDLRQQLLSLVRRLKDEGARIAAYGAAAKGATMINYVGLGPETLEFVVDRNVHKHGRYMPGQHVRIEAPDQLLGEQPDYTLMLAWNFRDEILEQQAEYRQRGGRFIVPVPSPEIV